MLQATVLKVYQDSFIDQTGNVQNLTRVQFTVGRHGPFTVSLPSSTFTAAAAQALMQPTVDAVNALVPQS